jgi:hypothetical protein
LLLVVRLLNPAVEELAFLDIISTPSGNKFLTNGIAPILAGSSCTHLNWHFYTSQIQHQFDPEDMDIFAQYELSPYQ